MLQAVSVVGNAVGRRPVVATTQMQEAAVAQERQKITLILP